LNERKARRETKGSSEKRAIQSNNDHKVKYDHKASLLFDHRANNDHKASLLFDHRASLLFDHRAYNDQEEKTEETVLTEKRGLNETKETTEALTPLKR
jgi:hypothetical protein